MAKPLSLDAASSSMREALQETVRKNSLLFLVQAALMIMAGLAAFAYPLLSSVALAVFLGWMLIFAGVVQVISLIGTTKIPNFWLQIVSAVLAVVIGSLFVRNPGAGVSNLTLLLIVFFMVEGMSKVVFSLSVRLLPKWGWVLASGVLGILIALYLLSNPTLSLVTLGLFIGMQLISEGAAIGWMTWRAGNS
jgi:uncharacterized membrane protein HdeD (DUF308 family)